MSQVALAGYDCSGVALQGYGPPCDTKRSKDTRLRRVSFGRYILYMQLILNEHKNTQLLQGLDIFCEDIASFNTFLSIFSKNKDSAKLCVFLTKSGDYVCRARATMDSHGITDMKLSLGTDMSDKDACNLRATMDKPLKLEIIDTLTSPMPIQHVLQRQLQRLHTQLTTMSITQQQIPPRYWNYLAEMKRIAHLDEYGLADVPLEQWNTHGAQDDLCLQWEGTIWEENVGPVPGTKTEMNDTHLNCKCTRDSIVLPF